MADVLVERAGPLASLEGLLGEALARAGLVFLGGEAGVGKTALAAALAEVAAGAGVAAGAAPLRRGSCDNITTAQALGPILDALPELAAAADQEAGLSRLRLFQKVREALSESAMVLLLEDVHWADEATLDVLRFLGRRLGGCRLLILATFRSEEVGRDHPLTMVLGELAGRSGVIRMQLPALSAAGVRQLVEAAGSALDPNTVFSRTGGNPFYVTEVLASGAGTVPVTVRDAVLARVARLSRAGQEVAGAASVLGRRAEADLLAAVSGQPLAAVDECVDRGVLVADGDGVGFRHELARLAVEQSLPHAERTVAHARALTQLLARCLPDDRRLAHHAAGAGDRAAVVRHAPLAAARAARLGAHREAAGQLQLALRYHEVADRQRAGLLDRLSYECYLTDQLVRARASGLEALAIYEREQDAAGYRRVAALAVAAVVVPRAERGRRAVRRGRRRDPGTAGAGPGAGDGLQQPVPAAHAGRRHGRSGALGRQGDRTGPRHRRPRDRDARAEQRGHGDVGHRRCDRGPGPATRSLDLALASDEHEHAARAYTNLGAPSS